MQIESKTQASLIIIQNRETQFDAPLYALIQRQQLFSLSLIYTTPASAAADQDDELGRPPHWNHLSQGAYPRRHLRSSGALAILRLAIELRRQQPSLVLICGYYPRCQLLLAILLRLLGQRIGLRSDNTLQHTRFEGWKGRIRRTGVGWIQRLFHTWHPVGEQALNYLRQLSGSQRPSFRFAYAVDNDWFAAAASAARAQRAAFQQQRAWPADAFVVLGILKWHPREDPLTLVQAFSLLQSRCREARLILVGDGPLREAVQRALAPLGDAVHCPGYVPYGDLPSWYARADVFVHPCPDEPWGVSVNEAMACGLPVIASDGVGAAHELLHDGVNGRVVPSRNPEALASALESLLREPAQAARWGERSRAAIANWSYAQTITALQQALAA